MENVKISVVVPIYHVEKYLDRCVRSIVAQSYRNLEIILVDDGSPDRCPEICDEWAAKDGRIKVIHKENAGLGMARNSGIEIAIGDYVCFVDSDDYIMPDALEKAYRAITENKAEVVHFGFQSIDSKGQCCATIIPETSKTVYRGKEIMEYLLPNLIGYDLQSGKYTNLNMSACMMLFSKKLIDKVFWRFVSEREILSEDIYSLLDLYGYITSAAILKEALYCYCENFASISRTYRTDRYQRTKAFFEESRKLCERRGYSETVKKQLCVPFLNSVSATLKQISRAQLPLGTKFALAKEIMEDAVLVDVLSSLNLRCETRGRRLLFETILHKQFLLAYCMIAIKARQ